MRIAFFGTYDERAHPRVQVLREGLEERGHEIVVLNRPLAFDTAARVRLAAQPWRLPAFAARLAVAWLRLLLTARKVGPVDVVVVGYLGAFDVHLAALRFRRATIVLDRMVGLADTVADRELGSARLAGLLARVDAAASRRADLVVCDTDAQAALAASEADTPIVVVPVGAPRAWAATTPAPAPEPGEPVRVVFFGLYTPLQGAPVIGRAIARLADRADLRFTMIGDGQDRPATEAAAAPNRAVRWLDWVPTERLPSEVAAHHVCLGIFGTGDKATRVVPNKVFQGRAAGCAIVTADTPVQRRHLDDAAAYVAAGDDRALAEALAGLADDRSRLARLRERSAPPPGSVVAPLEGAITGLHP